MPSFLVETQVVSLSSKGNPTNKMQDVFFIQQKSSKCSFPKIPILQILGFPQQKSRKKNTVGERGNDSNTPAFLPQKQMLPILRTMKKDGWDHWEGLNERGVIQFCQPLLQNKL
jgi:hypothetical protein